ncbi:hypothetical protein [Vitiosangium sp. GDMCC 1.1324]|uniref:hypothetical protein n=1 Tax=Vitiosangium sp. (strain GDMCC 1.1324) TaxID=2138576 RepID=UPI000D38D3A4|nr:hypothetical protein [Vitiosangium sp. GDMCC 1.1324]PTL75544.1 hypothetical protein DAT35_53960 [Vitiosangium sp. GDMCC 1.1324]
MADETVTLDKLKKVRARVEVSMVDARAALTAAAGNVETAVRALMTPEQLVRDRNAAIAEELVAEASRGVLPPAPAGPPPRLVTMNSETLHAILHHVPALEAFTAAAHPDCQLARIEESWDRFGDGTSQRTTIADFVLAPGETDLARAAAFTVTALGRKGLRRLPRDRERVRDAFEDGPRCLRVGPARAAPERDRQCAARRPAHAVERRRGARSDRAGDRRSRGRARDRPADRGAA